MAEAVTATATELGAIAKQAHQLDPFSLRRSAAILQETALLVARLAKHADRLQCATAETADLHTDLQALSDDVVQSARALKKQCQPCLESLAAVQGLSCSDDLMDELLHRMFSTNSTDMDVGVGVPTLSPMTSSDALSTSRLLHGIVARNRLNNHVVDEQLDSLLSAMPSRSSPCDAEREEHTLLRQLSLDGGAKPQTMFPCLSGASPRVAAEETRC